MPNLESFEEHAEIARLRTELRNLPDIEVDEAVWRSAASMAVTPVRPWWLRQPAAMAASVLLFTATAVFWLGNEMVEETPGYTPSNTLVSAALPDPQLTALMDRSQQLEQLASTTPEWRGLDQPTQNNGLNMSPLAQMILFELVRVDAEIEASGLTLAEDSVQMREQDLWQRRVQLLQAFIAEVEHSNPGSFDNDRSM